MKTVREIILCSLAVLFVTACQNDVNPPMPEPATGEQATVKFELDASALKLGSTSTRTFTPQYARDGFSIHAFKLSGSDYVFYKNINVSGMTYDPVERKLTGTDNLEIGQYKFVATYGIANQSSRLVPDDLNGKIITDNLGFSYNVSGPITEIFLENTDAASLPTPEFALQAGAANPTVSKTLSRAVARVDVMFLSAVREGSGYREVPYAGEGTDIFGGNEITGFSLNFTNLNNRMNLFGVDATQTQGTSLNVALGNFLETITIGDGSATLVGTTGYERFDNVLASDIMSGGAHVFGTYLLPYNEGATSTTGLQLVINRQTGNSRTINITNDVTKLPLEANKVTLVKVYVLNGNNVFSTTVDFEIVIDTVWEDAIEVPGVIS